MKDELTKIIDAHRSSCDNLDYTAIANTVLTQRKTIKKLREAIGVAKTALEFYDRIRAKIRITNENDDFVKKLSDYNISKLDVLELWENGEGKILGFKADLALRDINKIIEE